MSKGRGSAATVGNGVKLSRVGDILAVMNIVLLMGGPCWLTLLSDLLLGAGESSIFVYASRWHAAYRVQKRQLARDDKNRISGQDISQERWFRCLSAGQPSLAMSPAISSAQVENR